MSHYGATVLRVGPHFVSIAHKDIHAVIQSCNHFHVTLANVAMAMRNTLFKEQNKTNKKQNGSANIYGEREPKDTRVLQKNSKCK